jgi:hypothetical protein
MQYKKVGNPLVVFRSVDSIGFKQLLSLVNSSLTAS